MIRLLVIDSIQKYEFRRLAMTYLPTSEQDEHTLALNAEGRLKLPVSVRQKLELTEGDRLILSVSEDGVLQLMSLKKQVQSLRGILTNPDPKQSVVDELIHDRRRSAYLE